MTENNPNPSEGSTPPPAIPVQPLGYESAGEIELNKDARLWGMLAHLASLSGFIGIPFGGILGPLIIWMIKKNEFPFVDKQGKEALNFQISLIIYGLVSALLIFIFVGIILLIAVLIFDLVFVIIAAIKANKGESVRYPLTIRFIK